MQTTAHILMVRPANFGFNEETAASNAFQSTDTQLSLEEISQKAIAEFDQFVTTLRSNGIDVIVAEDSPEPVKPDAIFPNNWVTLHSDGKMILYPMYAPVRRLERQAHIIKMLKKSFQIKMIIHLEEAEITGQYLEGTGSMILDREDKIVYACLSPRTNTLVLDRFCAHTGFRPVVFHAVDGAGQDIYHTNVMMALGETFVVICLETIKDESELANLKATFEQTGKTIIPITLDQMLHFAGNMLQVRNTSGDTFLVMSEQAYNSLTDDQIAMINQHTQILHSPIYTIEKFGGGSARCMMAEVFARPKV